MLGKLRSRRPSHATVVAYLALFVALGGTSAFAAHETIFSNDIVDGQVQNPDLGTDAVSTTKIQTQGVANSDIAPNAITATRLAPESVETSEIKQGNVFNADLAGNTITSSRLAPDSVGTSELQDGAVAVSKLAPWSVQRPVDARGPLPREGTFTTSTGRVLVMASGSAFRDSVTHGEMHVGVTVLNQGGFPLQGFTNEKSSHKTLVSDMLYLTMPPGEHTVSVTEVNDVDCGSTLNEDETFPCTTTDEEDFFRVTVLELP